VTFDDSERFQLSDRREPRSAGWLSYATIISSLSDKKLLEAIHRYESIVAQLKAELLVRSFPSNRRSVSRTYRRNGEDLREHREAIPRVARGKRQERLDAVMSAVKSGAVKKEFITEIIKELLGRK
jgi:hypothetical protein